MQTRRAGAEDHGIDDERHARLQATEPFRRCRLRWCRSRAGVGCSSVVLSVGGELARRAHQTTHCPGVCNCTTRPGGAATMPTDAYNNTSSEERRALLERRRAEVARQMRGLAKELADLDRQLDEIEQSDR